MLLFLFAFISGLVTIAAPCIWPLLPIVLSASSTGGHKKPLGVTVGILASFGVLTLTLSYIVKILPINLDFLRLFAVAVLVILGLSLIIPKIGAILELYVSRFSGKLGGGRSRTGFGGGLLTGIILGIVWTPCAGPILATIATLAATTQVNTQLILVTLFYLVGIGIPLFIFSIIGRRIFTKTRSLSKYTGRIQQVFGIIMILTALLIFTGYDKVLSANLLNLVPSYSTALNSLESSSLIKDDLDKLKGVSNLNDQGVRAPEIVGIEHWLNLPADKASFSLKELRGKVILIDFWTYTCINCIRTLPHVTSWYERYKNQGFVVIGVHTPEFEFEKNTDNVAAALKQYGIRYPVAQDNSYATWNAYSNQYWPAEYLIDGKGIIRKTHFGEGNYDEMEASIVDLLKEAGKNVANSGEDLPDTTPIRSNSPETYLGAQRMEYLFPSGGINPGEHTFILERDIPQNTFSFGGDWDISQEYAVSSVKSVIEYNFDANNVNLVMTPGKNSYGRVKVLLDGKVLKASQAGSDVKDGVINVDRDRLFNIVDLHGKPGKHIIRLEFETPGIEAFAFTFG